MRIAILFLCYYSCALYSLVNPLIGVLFFIHITILRPESLAWGNLAFGRLHMTTALLTLIGYLSQRKNLRTEIDETYQRRNVFIFLVFLGWLLIVSILAENSVFSSFNKTVEVGKIFILCFLFSKLINTKDQIDLYGLIASISFGMLSLWGFWQGLVGNYRLDTLWPGGSNYIAIQLTLMMPFVLAKALDRTAPIQYRFIFLACALSIILCSIYTQSRAGFIGLSIGTFAFILGTKQRLRVLIGLAMIITLAYPWVPETFSDRINSAFVPEEERDASAGLRPVLWGIALRIWQDHPIAGVGLENFSPVKEAYMDRVIDLIPSDEMFALIFNQQRYPHGLYPGMLAETGLVGLGLFLTLLLRNMFCRFPSSTDSSENQQSLYLQMRGAQAGLIGFTVEALFGDFQYIEMLYLQLFFVGAVHCYAASLVNSVEAVKAGVPSKFSMAQALR
jgi:probable O-glycosylation ligase (exosortase A-associated)